jgi:hypothetical protein
LRAARIGAAVPIWRAAKAKHPASLAIAATTPLRSFTIPTGNARHFEPLGVPFLDSFLRLPPRRPASEGDRP